MSGLRSVAYIVKIRHSYEEFRIKLATDFSTLLNSIWRPVTSLVTYGRWVVQNRPFWEGNN